MVEKIKRIQKLVNVTADGVIGPKTLQAICNKIDVPYSSDKTTTIKNIQKACNSYADGIIGNNTLNAILNSIEDDKPTIKVDKSLNLKNRTYKHKLIKQSSIRRGNSAFGPAGCEDRLVSVKVPENYPLKYDGKRVKSIRIHELVADRLEAALNDIIDYYGDDIETIAPGACVYDGSYNFRKTRNSSSQSIHSWGLAIDFDASNNQLKTKAPNARLSQDVYKPFLDILEHHGFLSLGRNSNKDWMHVQATLWG